MEISSNPRAAYGRKVKLLMLEDNALDVELALSHLKKAGFEVAASIASSKQEYSDLLRDGAFDVILSDYVLPDLDGATALQMAKAHQPRVPFIVVSGRLGEEIAIDTLHLGATDYVLKQRIERLAPAVKRALAEAEEHSIRLRAEARARESEDRFQQLTNNLPQMVWTTDNYGNITYANDAWKRAVPEHVKHWRDPSILHPDDLGRCVEAAVKARRTREPFSMECRYLNRTDGVYHWCLLRAVPFESSEGTPAWLGTATDLHEQKLREESFRTAEKLAVTGRMAAAIAHEINNPLESLMNLVFLLQSDQQMDASSRKYIDMAEQELERVSSIVKKTLQYYREPETVSQVDALELFDGVIQMFQGRLRGKQIEIAVCVPEIVTFAAIAGEIRQVVVNLVANAIDAVEAEGKISLNARTITQEGPADQSSRAMAELTITDNGVGITREQAEQLFQPFFSTKGIHGTGLGLWVSKGIMEKSGGTLKLETREEDGISLTVATILLPAEAAEGRQQSVA